MPDEEFPDLERVQLHILDCGCQFLLGCQETRIRTEPEAFAVMKNGVIIQRSPSQKEIDDPNTEILMQPHGILHDVLGIHQYMLDVGLREDPVPEPRVRVITHDEAEDIVSAKREHEHWDGHVVPNGEQPFPRMCADHGKLLYNDETYSKVCSDNFITEDV